MLFATSMAYSAQEGGKLPEDFKFQKCDENDLECLEKRVSFLKQFKAYENSKFDEDMYEAPSLDDSVVSRRSGKRLLYQEKQPATYVHVNLPENMEYKTVHRGNVIDIIVTHKSSK